MGKKYADDTFSFRPFKSLKKLMEDKGFTVSGAPDMKIAHDPPGDEELFKIAMSKVREIKEFREMPHLRKPIRPVKIKKDTDEEAITVLKEIAQGKRPFKLSDTQEYIEWCHPDCSGGTAKKLHEGRFSVQDYLDLHGYTVDEAETEVDTFIKNALRKGLRCIKIIHGRGLRSPNGPVLKNALTNWLQYKYNKYVVAFVSARQCDGGLGALYLRLREK